jgi:hypothetical protein
LTASSALIDADNQVVLVGSPLNNEPLWELYKEHIRGGLK